MGTILITLFTFVLILISLLLILVVLMQRASSSGGMGAAFGGGMAEQTFGAETGNILTKATIWTAIAFFVISLGLYLGHMANVRQPETGLSLDATVSGIPTVTAPAEVPVEPSAQAVSEAEAAIKEQQEEPSANEIPAPTPAAE